MSDKTFLDFETTGLPKHIQKELDPSGVAKILHPDEAYKSFGHISATQFAYGDKNSTTHYNITDFETNSSAKPKGEGYRTKIDGIEVKIYKDQLMSENDIIKEISKDGSKLRGRSREHFVNSSAPEFYAKKSIGSVVEYKMPNGKIVYIGEKPFKDLLKQGQLNSTESKINEIMRSVGIDVKDITHADWSGKGNNSAYNFGTKILNKIQSSGKIDIGGWNPFFDINLLMAKLKEFGHNDLAMKIYNEYLSGNINVAEQEKAWQTIIYKLAKEDTEFAKIFKIPTTPTAAALTGRPGGTARTFLEHQVSMPWSADFVSGILSKHLGVQSIQEHAGGLDLHNQTRNLEETLVGILEKAGLAENGAIKADLDGNVSKILEQRLIANGSTLEAFKKDIEIATKRASKFNSIPTLGGGGGKFFNPKNLASRWGMLAGVIGLGAFATYNSLGEEELSPFSGKRKFWQMNSKYKGNRSFVEEDPSYSGHIGKLILGAATPLAGLYGVGLFSRWHSPRTFGVDRGDIWDYAFGKNGRGVLENIYYGIRRTEAAIPTARVFKISSLMDYFAPRQKNITFYNIRNGNISDEFAPRFSKIPWDRRGHGVAVNEFLASSKFALEQSEFERLTSLIKPDSAPATVSKRQVIIKSVKKGTRVEILEFDKNGVIIPNAHDPFNIDMEVKISNKDIINPNMSRRSFRAGKNTIYKEIWRFTDPTMYEAVQTTELSLNTFQKASMSEYIGNLTPPGFIQNNPKMRALWEMNEKAKYILDIVPKGIGQAENSLYPETAQAFTNLKSLIRVSGFSGDKFWSLDNFFKRFGDIRLPLRSYFFSSMNTFMESPFEVPLMGSKTIDKLVTRLSKSKSVLANMGGAILSNINRPHLGLPIYSYKHGLPQYVANFGLKRVLPAIVAYQGFQAVDHLLGKLTLSPTGQGPITTTAIKGLEWAHKSYALLSDITGFTNISKRQEQWAPGSTGLGIFAPALSAAFMYKTGELLYKFGPSAIRDTFNKFGHNITNKSFMSSMVKNALRNEPYRGALNRTTAERMLSFAIKNPKKAIFGLAMLPQIPFIPGFLGSNKSYNEVSDEYSGKKEVAVRKYRGWMLSSSPFGGGKPLQFRRHAYNLIESDWTNRGVLWPSYWKRLAHNASLGLYDKYMLEEYHKNSQPVYESAPYGNNLPLVGQLISSTIGRVIKPIKTYHQLNEIGYNIGATPYSLSPFGTNQQFGSAREVASNIGVKSSGSLENTYQRWSNQYHDLIGFRGFAWEALRGAVTGKSKPDEFVPYAQNANEMYNIGQIMWGFHAGDITGVGGEFLRRIFPYPRKQWDINDIPNELYGVSWIPQQKGKQSGYKDFTHGTTFDKSPMGWLYASRKGWEFLYPELKGQDLEQYPDALRLEILKQIGPYSSEFKDTTQKVMKQALSNQLTLETEQRFYDTLNQNRQIKDPLYAHNNEFSYELDLKEKTGRISNVDDYGNFMLEGSNRQYRLAGASTNEADIRANLLRTQKYNTTEQLSRDVQDIKSRTQEMIRKQLYSGKEISFQTSEANMLSNGPLEAIIGNLNRDLINSGAAFANTGNISSHNMQQDANGPYSSILAKYWSFLTNDDSFAIKKLINNRNYLEQYKSTQVFNREVKLWSRPIDHILKPFIASTLHRFGFDKIPGFTIDRRETQEYWDAIKYVKYKTLAVQAAKEGDMDKAALYHAKWRSTMIGADPTDKNERDEIAALPYNERPYFTRFANEPDPEKRGEIYKYIPRAARRLYSAIWNKKIAENSDDPKQLRLLQNLKETEGWGITSSEYKKYLSETGGNANKADWIRSRVIAELMQKYDFPTVGSMIWNPEVDVDNVALLTLREKGENLPDFGYFDERSRLAAFDSSANIVALEMKSLGSTPKKTINAMLSYIIQDDSVKEVAAMPTQSNNQIQENNMNTQGHQKYINKSNDRYASNLIDTFNYMKVGGIY